jgi:hypothetical protein
MWFGLANYHAVSLGGGWGEAGGRGVGEDVRGGEGGVCPGLRSTRSSPR